MWNLQQLLLLMQILHMILHLLKTAGNRIAKFLVPHLIPIPRTELRTSV